MQPILARRFWWQDKCHLSFTLTDCRLAKFRLSSTYLNTYIYKWIHVRNDDQSRRRQA